MDNIHSPIDLFYNDLYQFTCSYTYYQSSKHEQQATFQVFFRKFPFAGQYCIFAGLQEVKKFINSFKITAEHELFLKETLPSLTNEYFDWIKQDFRQRIKIRAFKQGDIVFSKEPLISYTGPLGFVQLLQTPILNLLGFASLVATNASRMAKAVQPKTCLQFGLRRAQGPNGGLSASVYSYIGGFVGTSNMKASQLHKIPCIGSMSHAFITAFNGLADIKQFVVNGVDIVKRSLQIKKEYGWNTHQGELASFLSFARSFPDNFKTLIDTYSTLDSGMRNTIIVGRALIQAGKLNIGIRLDSGDLCELSKRCRELWNKHVENYQLLILASDDLHEERLIQMEKNGSQIDIYAIGTNIATCKKQPALGLVCKLTDLDGTSKMKLSSDVQKSTLPGKKVVYRLWTNNQQKASFDVIALENEQITNQQHRFYSLQTNQSQTYEVTKVQEKNILIQSLITTETVQQLRNSVKISKASLPDKLFELQKPQKYQVLVTEPFYNNFQKTRNNISLTKNEE